MGFVFEELWTLLRIPIALVGFTLFVTVLLMGPERAWQRAKRAWHRFWTKRREPEQILTEVVQRHREHVEALKKALGQAEATEAEILRNVGTSEDNVKALEEEARAATRRGDDLGARGALYKVNLEQMAIKSFNEQLQRHRELIADARRRLYVLELRLRQYEVGRSILLSQLAEAKTTEQQYAIASGFDPFNAVADWQRAEGIVEEKALNARAAQRVLTDTAGLATGDLVGADPQVLEAQLAQLKLERNTNNTAANTPAEDDGVRKSRKQVEGNR